MLLYSNNEYLKGLSSGFFSKNFFVSKNNFLYSKFLQIEAQKSQFVYFFFFLFKISSFQMTIKYCPNFLLVDKKS